MLFPKEEPFFLGLFALFGSAKKIIPDHKDLVAIGQILGTLIEHEIIERKTSDGRYYFKLVFSIDALHGIPT